MGKKHKKHKSDKHGHEEYGDRPLKLVLKVSGSEVTAGGSSLDNTREEPAVEADKSKEKKKKKKKDKDKSLGSPEEDKGKKRMTKKKKSQEGEEEEREQSRTPIRSELDKLEEKEQTPLQEALNQLIRQLQRKDPSAFFAFPVTDLIAPNYSAVIKRPMDFSTMKEKVKRDCYRSLSELKVDFKLMCENAMIYNKPETIYHKAARKLLHSGMKILSQERLDSLKQSIDFMSGLEPAGISSLKAEDQSSSADGLERRHERSLSSEASERSTPGTPRQDKDSKDEAASAERELEEIRKAVEESGGKLSNRELQCELEFARRKSDGSTTLGILNSADLCVGDVGFCPVKLGMMSTRLQSGVNSLQTFREDRRNRVTPVSYLNYGPFTSYAPAYDSSFASISKDDSDLIYSLYGDEPSLQGSDSLTAFLAKSEEYVYKLADNLLDAMTNGEHSKTLGEAEMQPETPANSQERKEPREDGEPLSRPDAAAVGLQIDEELSEEAQHFQQKLDETTKLLRDLQEVQRERLSAKHPPNMVCLLAPTPKELELAEKVTGNLTELTGQVTPSDVSSVCGIRRAMGIALHAEPLIDLTTVQDTSEPMDASPDVVPLVTVK